MGLVIPYGLVKHQIPSKLSFLFKILYTEHTLFLHMSEKKEEEEEGKKKQIIWQIFLSPSILPL